MNCVYGYLHVYAGQTDWLERILLYQRDPVGLLLLVYGAKTFFNFIIFKIFMSSRSDFILTIFTPFAGGSIP